MPMKRCRGAILLYVLAILTLMAMLGAFMARDATARLMMAQAYRRETLERDREGGQPRRTHATIGDGAAGASSNGVIHGSQAFPPGRDPRVRRGTGR